MSDNCLLETYHWDLDFRDDETVEESQTSLNVQRLRYLLAKRDHKRFLAVIERIATQHHDFLQALGGEGLCLLLDDADAPRNDWLSRYSLLLLNRSIVAPPEAISRLATLLGSAELSDLVRQEESKRERLHAHGTTQGKSKSASGSAQKAILQVRRVVQIMQMFMGDGQFSDADGICRSVFRSPQERTFLRALSLRFPGLLALPNYPLDQIVALDRVDMIDAKTLRYGKNCRLDAVLIIPDEGDPVAVFELDSSWHDLPENARRDAMKNSLIAATGLPFFRLRAESSESMTVDEWYALLSDQVLPYLDLGGRIRCRQATYSLIPC